MGFNSLLACEYVCTEYVRWAIDNCRRSGATSFLDGEFPPTDASLWIDPKNPPSNEVIEHPDHWKPVKRMCFQPSLFGKRIHQVLLLQFYFDCTEISLSLLEQGNIGTSNLLGVIALLAARADCLQDMFVSYGI